MTDARPRVSPSHLAVYAVCPRQYFFDKIWSVEAPERSRRYLDRGLAYHGAIEETCNTVKDNEGMSDADIVDTARAAIEDRWEQEIDREEYASQAQYEYDRELTVSAVVNYFESDGAEHARRSIGTERWLTCDYNGVRLHGRVDNIVRTDDGLEIIDYKGSLNNIVSGSSADQIEEHRNQEDHCGDILKSVFQAAAYTEGVKETAEYEPGMDIEFTYYGVMHDKDRQPGLDGIRVSANGNDRQVGWIYEAYHDQIWALIDDCYEGICTEDHEAEPWELIQEHACSECDYQQMCPDYLGQEVRVDD